MKRRTPRRRKYYPKDIGKRFCIICAIETVFFFSESENTWVCEKCKYQKSMIQPKTIDSEKEFLDRFKKGEIP